MKLTTKEYEAAELSAGYEKSYPFEENIINISNNTATNCDLVTWQFDNHQFVQLLFYSPENATLLSISPALVFPNEGDEGRFYTKGEIKLYLSQIKALNKNDSF